MKIRCWKAFACGLCAALVILSLDARAQHPWSWGNSEYGQLGDGHTFMETRPVQALTPANVTAVSGACEASLARRNDGTAWVWGWNEHGQLGDGTYADSCTPSQVAGLTGVTAVAGGAWHSLALLSDGTVWAWGDNSFGQLGSGSFTSSNVPVQVSDLTGVVAVAAGYWHSIAVKGDGTVVAWGRNTYGQLGNASYANSNVPVPVSGLTGVTAIAGGIQHSLALKDDGKVWAWGWNEYGQLGHGYATYNIPVQVDNLMGATAISAGAYHSLARKSDGTVWTWGSNGVGQLGNGTRTNSCIPVQAQGLTGMTSVAGGDSHSIALKGDGTVWTWGYNAFGQLGIGTWSSYSLIPVQVLDLTDAASIAGGYNHCIARKEDGTVWSWGSNYHGQLGDGHFVYEKVAQPISNLTGVRSISGGEYHSLAARVDGTAWAWGFNREGELGNGGNTDSSVPVPISGLSGVTKVAAGYQHSLAIAGGGTVWAWGRNWAGELGNGTYSDSNIPVPVTGLSGVIAIAGGPFYSLALKDDGTVWAWGDNTYGQLGDGTNNSSNVPVQVIGLEGATAISAGGGQSLAVKGDGAAWAWGANWCGQLGNGSYDSSNVPVQVSNLTGVIAIAGGATHSLATLTDGTVWAWGSNDAGQLGNGDTTPSCVPVQVSLLTGATAVTAGNLFSLATKGDGTAWAWGLNGHGQLGIGSYENSSVPVQVLNLEGVIAVSAGERHTLATTCPSIAVSPSSLPDGQLATPYSETVSAGGGDAPHSYTTPPGSLPPGLILHSGTGVMDGTPSAAGTYEFTVTATDAFYCTGSRAYAITIGCEAYPPPPVTTPGSRCGPGSLLLGAGGAGAGEDYAWYGSPSGGPPLQRGGASFTTPPISSTTTFYVTRFVVSTLCESAPRSPVEATVHTIPSPLINGPGEVCAGGSIQLEASAGYSSYLWSPSNETTRAITVSPSTTTGYTVTVADANACQGTSSSHAVSVLSPPGITMPPSSRSTCVGGSVTFDVTASGDGLAYRWQSDSGSGFSDLGDAPPYSGTGTARLEISSAGLGLDGHAFRCVVSGACPPAATSASATLTVLPQPIIDSHPSSQTACGGSNANFAVSASGYELTYQWQLSVDYGATFTDLTKDPPYTGVASPALTVWGVQPSQSGSFFRCSVKDSCGSTTPSSHAALTVTGPYSEPVLLAISDAEPCAQSGVRVSYLPAVGASRHDLYRDGLLAVTDYGSGAIYNPGDSLGHHYFVRAILGSCVADSGDDLFADGGQGPPSVAPLFVRTEGNDMLIWWGQLDPSLVDSYEVMRALSPSGPFDTLVGTASGILDGIRVSLDGEPTPAYYKVRAVKNGCRGTMD